jgi:hypothetical protein
MSMCMQNIEITRELLYITLSAVRRIVKTDKKNLFLLLRIISSAYNKYLMNSLQFFFIIQISRLVEQRQKKNKTVVIFDKTTVSVICVTIVAI